jgi:hypothetical protein
VTGYLDFYEQSATRKGLLLHQETEKQYLQPLSKRVVKRLTGPGYDRYLRSRSHAISAFETAIRGTDTLNRRLPPIPTIRVDTTGLRDPVMKYKYTNAAEDRLAKVITESDRIAEQGPKFQERDTMDLKRWRSLAETRFYAGTTEKPVAKGRRVFERHGKSRVGAELDAFTPHEATQPHVRKPQVQERDHVAEQW